MRRISHYRRKIHSKQNLNTKFVINDEEMSTIPSVPLARIFLVLQDKFNSRKFNYSISPRFHVHQNIVKFCTITLFINYFFRPFLLVTHFFFRVKLYGLRPTLHYNIVDCLSITHRFTFTFHIPFFEDEIVWTLI